MAALSTEQLRAQLAEAESAESAATLERAPLEQGTVVSTKWHPGDKGDSFVVEVHVDSGPYAGDTLTDFLSNNDTVIQYQDERRKNLNITNAMKTAKLCKFFGLRAKGMDQNIGKKVTGRCVKEGEYGEVRFRLSTGGHVEHSEEAEERNKDAF